VFWETEMKYMRVRLLMWIARLLGVPIQVHQAFFVKGINLKMSPS